ncbi:UNVERIFIED_CONTAM: hypothetical protein FKN15_047899 [Acipenser sinensis]
MVMGAPPLLAAKAAGAPPLQAAKAAGLPPLQAVKAAGLPPLLAAKAAGLPPLLAAKAAGLPPLLAAKAAGLPPLLAAKAAGLPPLLAAKAAGLPPLLAAKAAGLPPLLAAKAAGLPPLLAAKAAGLPPLLAAKAAGLPPLLAAKAAGLPPLLAAKAAGLPPLLAAKAAGLPPLLAAKAAGLPPLLAAKAAGLPPLLAEKAAGLPPLRAEKAAGLPPLWAAKAAGLPPLRAAKAAGLPPLQAAKDAEGLVPPNHGNELSGHPVQHPHRSGGRFITKNHSGSVSVTITLYPQVVLEFELTIRTLPISLQEPQFRSRSIETFGQFKGLVCTQPIGDSKSCKTQAVCDHEEPQCPETHFLCDSGRCIKKRLECNGDNDCGDQSDENCDEEPKRPPCQNRDVEVSELGRTAGYGVNVLRMEPRSNPFDNEYYNGNCDRVKDGNTRQYYRRPWNVATLLYETFADESFSKEVYETSDSLVKEILTESSLGFEVGMSFKIKPTEGPISAANGTVDINLGANFNRAETLNTLNEYSVNKTQSFLRVKGRIQLGTFRIRSRDLMLTDTFMEDLKFLPVEYEKGEYFRFFEDYGTHYAVSGKVGGQYDLVFVINKQELKRRNMEIKDVQDCLGFNLGMDINAASMSTFTTNIKPKFCKKTKDGTTDMEIKDVQDCLGFNLGMDINAASMSTFTTNIKPKFCKKTKDGTTGTKTTNDVIENTLSFVHGGTAAYAASFRKQINEEGVADVSSYIEWAKSLSDAAVLIETTPTPIYTLVPVTKQHANIKKENMERALNDYIAEYNVCKCKPCQNGGTVTLLDGKCICLCPINYEGLACQTLKKTDLKGK